jgi:hypothetical protein
VLHEVFAGKSIVLLVGGLLIGWVAGGEGIKPLDKVFFDLFKGALAIFLLEMGLVAASRLGDLRRAGTFLLGFAIGMPLFAGALARAHRQPAGHERGRRRAAGHPLRQRLLHRRPGGHADRRARGQPGPVDRRRAGDHLSFNLMVGIPTYHWLASRLGGVV